MKVFDLEKLDALPHFQKKYVFVNSSGKIVARKEYRYGRGASGIYTKARQILPKFVGKSFDEYSNCLRKYFNENHGLSFRYVSNISTMKETSLGLFLIDPSGRIHNTIHNRWAPYYVDIDGIIQGHPKEKRQRYTSQYSYIADRRKNRKKKIERVKLEILEVSLINNTLLHKYFISLTISKKTCLEIINAPIPAKPVYGERMHPNFYKKQKRLIGEDYVREMKSWRLKVRNLQKNKIEYSKRLKIVNEKLTNLFKSNLSDYYENSIYLHSIGKECHHF